MPFFRRILPHEFKTSTFAGIASLATAACLWLIWIIALQPMRVDTREIGFTDQVDGLFSDDNTLFGWIVIQASITVVYTVVGFSYFVGGARSHAGRIVLLCLLALTTGVLVFEVWALDWLACVSTYYGWRCVTEGAQSTSAGFWRAGWMRNPWRATSGAFVTTFLLYLFAAAHAGGVFDTAPNAVADGVLRFVAAVIVAPMHWMHTSTNQIGDWRATLAAVVSALTIASAVTGIRALMTRGNRA